MIGSYRFLFDECLSADLVAVAASFGYASAHVKHIGRLGASDRSLAITAVDDDLVLVTNNRVDFPRIYSRLDLHPSLIVLIPNATSLFQRVLFGRVAERLVTMPDIVNKLVQIDAGGVITIEDFPEP
jgi:predicted nuclease of predicted toxin-antitoxin system